MSTCVLFFTGSVCKIFKFIKIEAISMTLRPAEV